MFRLVTQLITDELTLLISKSNSSDPQGLAGKALWAEKNLAQR
jgi:hypothetical protein